MEDIKQRLKISRGEFLMYLSMLEVPAEQAYPDSVLTSMGERGSYVRRRIIQSADQLWEALHSSESVKIGVARFCDMCSTIFQPGLVDAETVLKALYEIRIANSYRQELCERSGVNFDPLTYRPLIEQADALGLVIVVPNFERSVYSGEVVALDYCYLCYLVRFASRKAIVLPFAASPGSLPPMIGAKAMIRFSDYKLSVSVLERHEKTRELGAG